MFIDLNTDDNAFLFMASRYSDFITNVADGRSVWVTIQDTTLINIWLVEVVDDALGAYEYQGKFYYQMYFRTTQKNGSTTADFDSLAKTTKGWYSIMKIETVLDNRDKVFDVEIFNPAVSSMVIFTVKE